MSFENVKFITKCYTKCDLPIILNKLTTITYEVSNMKKITILLTILLIASSFVNAATGWYNDFVKLNVNGAGTVAPTGWYWIGADPTYATQLDGAALGAVTTLVLEGCDMKYWSDTQDRTGGSFFYKITNDGGTVDYIAATEVIWDQVSLGGNDYQGTKAVSIDVLADLPYGAGSYKLHVWSKSWGADGDSWLTNTGANYVATFSYTKANPVSFSGTYKVGESTGTDFTSLSAAVAAINAGAIAGNVVLEITSDITEVANIGLGVNTNGFGITIRPDADANRTITFTKLADNISPTGHLVIGYTDLTTAWADANTIATNNVTIDGYANGGSTRRLTFTNTSASHTNARGIVVVGACENTIVKNSIINNLTTSTGSPFCIGAVARKGTAIEVAPIGLTFENNILTALGNNVAMGVRLTNSGTLTTVRITGFVFKNNIVSARRRLVEINYTTGGEIYNNEFITQQTGAPGTISYGLWTSSGVTGTLNIYNNKFIEAFTEETGAFGHRVVSLSSGATYNIYNNTFAGLDKTKPSTAATSLTYLFYSGVAGTIYNNTFYMPVLTDASSTGYYSAIQLSGNTATIKNNIFINDEPTHANTYFISAVPTPNSDYNDYFLSTPHAGGKIVSTYVTLAEYQTANPTKDINSISKDVNFVDVATGDLHLTGASLGDTDLIAEVLASVTTDMDGETRSLTFPYMGADENLANLLPVELTKFDATLVDDGVMLYWSTATEVNNYGFEVEVSTDGENWENVGFVEGHGNSNSQQDYNFLYTEPFNNKVNFRLKQVDTDGGFEYSEVVSVLSGEASFKLNQNYPNPFNPTTVISFSLKASAKVTLKVYNALGQEVAVLANNVMDAGFHEVDFDASNLASGVYIYRLDAPGYSKTMKMMLLK